MTKEQIMDNYAKEQGYEDWKAITKAYGMYGEITTTEYIEHQENLINIFISEIKSRIAEELHPLTFFTDSDREKCKESIINNDIFQ